MKRYERICAGRDGVAQRPPCADTDAGARCCASTALSAFFLPSGHICTLQCRLHSAAWMEQWCTECVKVEVSVGNVCGHVNTKGNVCAIYVRGAASEGLAHHHWTALARQCLSCWSNKIPTRHRIHKPKFGVHNRMRHTCIRSSDTLGTSRTAQTSSRSSHTVYTQSPHPRAVTSRQNSSAWGRRAR